jgi:hypothetical protein
MEQIAELLNQEICSASGNQYNEIVSEMADEIFVFLGIK